MIEIMEGSGWDFHTTELGYSHRLLCLHVDGFENQVHLQKKKTVSITGQSLPTRCSPEIKTKE
jgi:hypothetical protein